MIFIILTLAFLTMAALVAGLVIMGRGSKVNKNLSNKFMIARVAFQAITIAALLIAMLVSQY